MSPLSWRRPEAAIPLVYVAVAGAWEIGSESLVSWLTGTPDFVERWEIVKDLVFVLLCGLALAAGVRQVVRRLQAEATRRVDAERALARGLQGLAARLTDVREAEQARIGRDLHDDLGQLVTALSLTQRGVERLAAQLQPTEAQSALLARSGEARELAGQVLASIRRITADLRPVALQQRGLPAALEREAEALAARSGVSCRLEADTASEALPDRVALTLFRIGQEALTNVARHAEATRCVLRLGATDTEAWLRVEDDGRGFRPGDGPALGLLGMRERALAAGGELEVRTTPGHGTVIAARLPLVDRGRGDAAA